MLGFLFNRSKIVYELRVNCHRGAIMRRKNLYYICSPRDKNRIFEGPFTEFKSAEYRLYDFLGAPKFSPANYVDSWLYTSDTVWPKP